MLHYAAVFLIIALIAGFFGFFGIAGLAAEIAKILDAGAMPLIVGGDHSVCVPGTRALSEHLGSDRKMGYVHLDAHLDQRGD